MLRSTLVEDLNRLACAAEQERYADDPERARQALESLRFPDTTELDRFLREGALSPEEADLIERLLELARERLAPVPADEDPVRFTRRHSGWLRVRDQALELLQALDAFVDLGVPGWGGSRR